MGERVKAPTRKQRRKQVEASKKARKQGRKQGNNEGSEEENKEARKKTRKEARKEARGSKDKTNKPEYFGSEFATEYFAKVCFKKKRGSQCGTKILGNFIENPNRANHTGTAILP